MNDMTKYLVGYFMKGGFGTAIVSFDGKVTENIIDQWNEALTQTNSAETKVFIFSKLESEDD